MEFLWMSLSLAVSCGAMALEIMAACALRRVLTEGQRRRPERESAAELPEEQEARRMAAEAQRLYEQGFVNLMRYDGRPGQKEREMQ